MPDSDPAPRRGPAPARPSPASSKPPTGGKPDKAEHEILFQKYFKSVGPRTYAAQVKRAANGNHYLVLTEGKRDEATGDVRKTRLFVFSEDFVEFFRMLHETAQFIKANPVPDEVKKKRQRFWARKAVGDGAARPPAPGRDARPAPPQHGKATGPTGVKARGPFPPPPGSVPSPRAKQARPNGR